MTPVLDALDHRTISELEAAGATVSAIGTSEHGRTLHGVRIGDKQLPVISIVAGAHPDEPAGPVAALELIRSWSSHPLCRQAQLAVVPLIDVDGVVAQRGWLDPWDGAIDVARYLEHRLRRLPGADREFAWPGAAWGGTVLPENQAAAEFFDSIGPGVAHLSLHGMFTGHGPWYLLDHHALRHASLWQACRSIAQELDFPLHDDVRYGDKGFRRVTTGFSTTPSGPAMRRFFLNQGDRETANGFGYSSMDSARARAKRHGAAAPLCAVSEFPLLFLHHLPTREQYAEQRQALQSLVAQQDFAAAATLLASGTTPVPLAKQVRGMLAMTRAVIAAATT